MRSGPRPLYWPASISGHGWGTLTVTLASQHNAAEIPPNYRPYYCKKAQSSTDHYFVKTVIRPRWHMLVRKAACPKVQAHTAAMGDEAASKKSQHFLDK